MAAVGSIVVRYIARLSFSSQTLSVVGTIGFVRLPGSRHPRPWQPFWLCLGLVGEVGGGESFQGHTERNTLGNATSQTLIERLALEPAVQIGFCGQPVSDFKATREHLVVRQHLGHDPPSFRSLRVDGLAAPQQPLGPHRADDLFPDHLETITGSDPKRRMWEITIRGALRSNVHVGQEQVLRVDGSRTVGDPNDRHGKIEQVLEDVDSLAANFLPVRRLEDVAEAGSIDRSHKSISCASEKERTVVLIESDLLKRTRQVFLGLAGEGNWSAVGLETHCQDAIVRAREGKVFVACEVAWSG